VSERVDPDYNPSDKEIEDVARLLARSAARVGSVHYNGNGNGFITKWLLGVMAGLIIAGVPWLIWKQSEIGERLARVETGLQFLLAGHK
jgi:hypothetical protein